MGGVVFLSCQLFGMGCPALGLDGHWVELGLSVETKISGRALADWYYEGPGGLWWTSVLNSALPPQRLSPHTWPLLPVSPPLVPSKLCCRVMFFTCDRSCQSSFPKPIRGSFLTEELRFLCRHRYPPRFYCGPSIQVTSPVSPQNPFYSSQATHPSLTLSFFKFFFFFFLSIRNGHLQFFLIIPAVFTGRNPTYLSRSILECDLLDEALIYLYNHDYCLLLC